MTQVERYLEMGYALIVVGLAWVYPPLGLLGAGVFLLVLAYVTDRRT